MELGLLYEFDVPQPWAGEHPWGQRTEERRVYRENIEQIVLADKLGFEAVWLVEHHFRENRSHMPSNEVVLGALSQITERIKLGFGVALMPHEFTHPARVAEKVATVDLLSRGRAIWGMGRSTPMEQIAFGVDIPASKEKMKAAARTVVGMWREEYYEEHSEYLDFPKRMVTPKPYQYPHPPAWMAAATAGSAAMAGENGLGLLCFSIMQPLDKLKEVIDAYRDAQKTAVPLTAVQTNKVGVYTLVHCTDTRDNFDTDRVWESMWWWYKGIAEFHLKWELAHLTPEQQAAAFPLLESRARGEFDITEFDREDMVIVGTPDEVLEKLMRYEEAGVDQLLCYLNFGYLPHEAVMRSIELLGTKVIPELKRRGAVRLAQGLEEQIRKAEHRTDTEALWAEDVKLDHFPD
ncbi:LLM class flavin-dependent oxidoreductase [Novosphingobium sp. G106]|uniref:LLM class flavin-dependent oxidoreductase n=1 Tax=Novosphingobium sp. G106 TaxID=2849500 RepID=UPI001C2DE012|nr:LLM class flavin-dependent oxidoreductase [Novosphingobium sp. G106]MBV1687842.1 LLM class flavin-dependent oxidoreductase [Novosphingobium sp. G106]